MPSLPNIPSGDTNKWARRNRKQGLGSGDLCMINVETKQDQTSRSLRTKTISSGVEVASQCDASRAEFSPFFKVRVRWHRNSPRGIKSVAVTSLHQTRAGSVRSGVPTTPVPHYLPTHETLPSRSHLSSIACLYDIYIFNLRPSQLTSRMH